MSTYYVSTSGSDGAAGTSEGAAWATIDKGMNTVAAGDKVWVKGDGDYAELATMDAMGTATNPIIFEGYTTTTGDGGRATITGSNSRNACIDDSVAGVDSYYVFKNFRFTASTANGVITGTDHLAFKNCKFDANSNDGLQCGDVVCENCEFSSNGNNGALVANGSSNAIMVMCKFYSNTGAGVVSNTGLVVYGCTFFDNGGRNIEGGGSNRIFAIFGCTVDGNAKNSDAGIYRSSTSVFASVNNVLYDCVTGMTHVSNSGESVVSKNNLVNNNTTPYSGAATFTGEVTFAPQFTNEVGGADYTPAVGSPLINAGLNGQ